MSNSNNNPSIAGGVRNLRALFETKPSNCSTSPPSRGRSPSNSEVSNHSRPVNKVRASFVAVEKPGENGQPSQWGLRKASEVSSMAEIKENGVKDHEVNGSSIVESENQPARPESVSAEARPSHIRHITQNSIDGGLGSILKGSSFESSSPTKNTTPRGGKISPKEPAAQPKNIESLNNKSITPSRVPPGSAVSRMKGAMDSVKLPHNRTTPLVTTNHSRPLQPKTTPDTRTRTKPNSPTFAKGPKTPVTPASAVSAKSSPNLAKGDLKPKSPPNPQTHKSESKSTQVKSDIRRSVPNGSAKPQPKSPTTSKPKPTTKPLSLPASLTAPTAASAAKNDTLQAREVDTKPASTARPSKTATDKKPSSDKGLLTAKRPPRASMSSTATSQAKKTPRASLQPQTNGRRPKSRLSTASKAPDEGFLARMMRPTASSAQKVHEKVPDKSQPRSPPRTKRDAPARNKTRSSTESTKSDEDRENGALKESANESLVGQQSLADPNQGTEKAQVTA